MKYYCRSNNLGVLDSYYKDYELLFGVDVDLHGRGVITKLDWGAGWILDADDEYLPTFLTLKIGVPIVFEMLEDEVEQLLKNNVVYLSLARTRYLRKRIPHTRNPQHE